MSQFPCAFPACGRRTRGGYCDVHTVAVRERAKLYEEPTPPKPPRVPRPRLLSARERASTKGSATIRQRILMAAALHADEYDEIASSRLVIAAWTEWPDAFGLAGYESKYPDSNKVLSKLAGAEGLCELGWLERATTGVVRVTPKGKKLATLLRANKTEAPQ